MTSFCLTLTRTYDGNSDKTILDVSSLTEQTPVTWSAAVNTVQLLAPPSILVLCQGDSHVMSGKSRDPKLKSTSTISATNSDFLDFIF